MITWRSNSQSLGSPFDRFGRFSGSKLSFIPPVHNSILGCRLTLRLTWLPSSWSTWKWLPAANFTAPHLSTISNQTVPYQWRLIMSLCCSYLPTATSSTSTTLGAHIISSDSRRVLLSFAKVWSSTTTAQANRPDRHQRWLATWKSPPPTNVTTLLNRTDTHSFAPHFLNHDFQLVSKSESSLIYRPPRRQLSSYSESNCKSIGHKPTIQYSAKYSTLNELSINVNQMEVVDESTESYLQLSLNLRKIATFICFTFCTCKRNSC